MGTPPVDAQMASALFGKSRRAVLGLLYGHADQSFYVRQIVRSVGLGQGTVQRELARLAAAGILSQRHEGNQVYFQANPQSPVFPELKSLVVKTMGVGDVLQFGLQKLASRINVAFVYGSLASGKESRKSDVDLMVVGKVTFGEVAAALNSAQESIGREVNASVYSPTDFKKKLKTGHHFLTALLPSPKIFLIGDQRELEKLGS